MATKVKPSRLQVSWTPQVWQVPVYVDEDTFSWWTGGGSWDVSWPASSTDWDVVLFDWATGKLIKDSWVGLSSKLDATALSNNAYWGSWNGDTTHTPTKDALYDKIHTMDVEIWNKAADTSVVKLTWNQTIAWTKTFSTSPVVPSKSTAATNSDTAIATEAQVKLVADDVATINWKIPSAATSSNQLADKNYVDDGINSVTAYYITKNAQGDQWATRAELFAATTFYSGWVVRVPTKNDYTIVLADENHDNATTRYIYNSGWEYQYTVNETALTQAQLDALNSWITSGKVSSYDSVVSTIAWYGNIVTHNTSEFATSTQGTKADTALQPNDNISELNNDAWYITWVDWGDIGWTLSDQVDLQNALNAKANDNAVVHNTWAETIDWTKTFSTSPVVPNKTADATNTGTAIATEAQVYKKQDKLESWTNIKTINWNSILGSWNITVSSSTTTTCTLTSAWWSSNSQTVSATGVTASNTVIVSPAPANISTYADCGVYCSAQGSGTLTFKCDTVPSGSITVNVLIMS